MIEKALQQNIQIGVIPFIAVDPKEDNALREKIVCLANEQLIAIFTSGNGVRSVAAMLPEAPHWDIACLDGNTLDKAAAYFGWNAIKWTATDAAALAGKIAGASDTGRIVFFCGDKRMDYLPSALKTAGRSIEEVVVYETRNLPQKINRSFDGILFFSPSAVDSFFEHNHTGADTELFAIGKTTALALEKYTNHKIFISPEHSPGAMIDQLIAFFEHEK